MYHEQAFDLIVAAVKQRMAQQEQQPELSDAEWQEDMEAFYASE